MTQYHQIRVACQLLADEGSIRSHVQLQKTKMEVNRRTITSNMEYFGEVGTGR